VPLGHALIEHEIRRHPPLRGRVLPADLLHQGRVVVGLARPLCKRGGTCTQEDDRCKNGYWQARPLSLLIDISGVGPAAGVSTTRHDTKSAVIALY
jgi:hypothetical protein